MKAINFNTDNLYGLFMDYLYGDKNGYFTYIGEGASKAAFLFFEETTNKKYIIKIEKDYYIDDILNEDLVGRLCFEDIEESNECYEQTKKEIETYRWAKENNLDLFLAPILLEYSSAAQQFEVMCYCEDLNKNVLDEDSSLRRSVKESVRNTIECSTHGDTIGGFIVDYLIVNKGFSQDLIKELYRIGKELLIINEGFFDDCGGYSNLGIYNGKLVLRDYGYGYME